MIDTHTFKNISAYLINHLAHTTNKRIEDDLFKFKQKFLQNYSETDFNHLFTNQALVDSLPEDIKEEFLQLQSIREQSRHNFVFAKNKLAILNVKAGIEFPDPQDALHAFLRCLPEYFNTQSFLTEIKTVEGNKILTQEEVDDLMLPNYVWDTIFVKQHKIKPDVEEALMFFVGTQLINTIF